MTSNTQTSSGLSNSKPARVDRVKQRAATPGIDQVTFQSIAAKAKAGCPVSKLMKVEIGFGATLLS